MNLNIDLIVTVFITIVISAVHYFIDSYIFKKKSISYTVFLASCIWIIIIFTIIFNKLYYTPWSFISIYQLSIVLTIILVLLTLIRVIRKKLNNNILKVFLCIILLIIYVIVYYIAVLWIYCNHNVFVRSNYGFEVESYISDHLYISHSNKVFVYKNGDIKILNNIYDFGNNPKIKKELSNKNNYDTIFDTIKIARDEANSDEADAERKEKAQAWLDSKEDNELKPDLFYVYTGYNIRFKGESIGKILYNDYISKYNLDEVFQEIEKYTDENIFE